MKFLRWLLLGLAALVLIAAAGLAVVIATFDVEAQKPRIAAAVRDATGREIAFRGPIRLRPSLQPTLVAEDVGFANAPWGSRSEMARVASLEVKLALLPLVRGEVAAERIVLIEPDILLETDREGRGNWELRPAAAPAPGPRPAERREALAVVPAVAVETLRIERGTITVRDGETGRTTALTISRLEASLPVARPSRIDLDAALDGVAIALVGSTGPVGHLVAATTGTPFPIDVTLRVAEARLAVKGTIAEPRAGRGYDFAITASVPDLARLAAAVPAIPGLPPLRGLNLSLQARDGGRGLPEIRSVVLKTGPSDLSAVLPGFALRAFEVSAPDAASPLRLSAELVRNGMPASVSGEFGPLGALFPGAEAKPWPVALRLSAGAASLAVTAALHDLPSAPRAHLRLEARAQNLAALSPLAGIALPTIEEASLAAALAGPDRAKRVAVRDLALRLGESDLGGTLTVQVEGRPAVSGSLASRLLDLDALLAALPRDPGAAGHPSPPAAAAAPPRRPTRLIPNEPLPLDALRAADADLRLAFAELRLGGNGYRDVSGTIRLRNGDLAVEPVRATLPGGPVTARLVVGGSQPEPEVALRLSGPSLALRDLLSAYARTYRIAGDIELDIDLRGRGATPHRIASTLDGHFGIAGVNIDIDNRLIDLLAGELWRALVPNAPRDGVSNVRCVALRFDAAAGNAQARAFLIDSNLVRVSGTGSVALGPETLALRLSPTLKLAGGGIGVPVNVGGTFLNPSVRVDPRGAIGALGQIGAGATAGATAGAAAGPLGAIVGGVMGAARGGGAAAGPGDTCAAQLAVARGGRAGPVPADEVEPATSAPAPAGEAAQPAAPRPLQELQERLPAPLQQILPRLGR
ncbi:MAG: AsmA family protein [Elioraea sp.]|nr:AsmA family protein [Elioraea sp.]